MDGTVFKRCGCSAAVTDDDGIALRAPNGRIRRHELGRTCPQLTDANRSWSPTHGTWFFQIEDPATPGRHFRRGGYASRPDAQQAVASLRELIALAASAPDPTAMQSAISQAVHSAIAHRAPLPDVNRVTDRLRRGLSPTPTLTVGHWLTTWLAERTDLRPATRLNYAGLITQHLIPTLGHVLLEELRPTQIQAALAQISANAHSVSAANTARRSVLDQAKAAWRAHDAVTARAARAQVATMPGFRRPVGASTVQRTRAVLRSALSEAVRRELVTVNAAKLVKLATPRRARPLEWTPARVALWRKTGRRPSPVMVWTPAHTRRFLDHTSGHPLHALFVLLAYTGMRRGEACGLAWEDLDLDKDVADIHRQLLRIGTETVEGPPKTDAGNRPVALARPVARALRRRRHAQLVESHAAGAAWADTGLVFTNLDGTALNPADVTYLFDRLIRDAALPPIRLHDLRHGAATHALEAGVPVKVVSDMLGHSSITVTFDLYATVTDRSRHAAANAIAQQLER